MSAMLLWGAVCAIAFLVMLLNTQRSTEYDDVPVFGLATVAFCMSGVFFIYSSGVVGYTADSLMTWLSGHLFTLLGCVLGYGVIGTVYSLLIWRWRILPKVVTRVKLLLDDTLPVEDAHRRLAQNRANEFYIPEGEQYVLPVLKYHAAHLIWLINFWFVDLLSSLLCNSLRIIFIDFPRTVGTLAYNAMKAQFERIARSVMR